MAIQDSEYAPPDDYSNIHKEGLEIRKDWCAFTNDCLFQ